MAAIADSIAGASVGVRARRTGIGVGLLAAALAGAPASAATLTVCASGCEYATVTAALAAAADGDTITVAAGTYAEGVLTIDSNITLQGAGSSSTVLVGNGAANVLSVQADDVTLDGLTIRGGGAVGNNGGGVSALGGSLTIRNCAITDNVGPGVASVAQQLTVTDTVISSNSAVVTQPGSGGGVGGGIAVFEGALTLIGGEVRNNAAATAGGGIAILASATISDSVIDGNTSGQDGGGISLLGTLTLQNSSVTGNQVGSGTGGGIWSNQGDLTVLTSTVAGNSALGGSGEGGGLYLASFFSNDASGPFEIENSTISGNRARLAGAGIAVANQGDGNVDCSFDCLIGSSTVADNQLTGARAGAGAGIDVANADLNVGASIIANNTGGPNCGGPGTVRSGGFNVAGDATCDLTGQDDLPSTNPLLLPLSANPPGMTETMALCAGVDLPACTGRSPAIGLDANCPPPSTDQRGVARPVGRCDSGAYQTGGLGEPEPTPTTPPRHDSDDGCAVTAPARSRHAGGLLAPLVSLLLRRKLSGRSRVVVRVDRLWRPVRHRPAATQSR